MVVVLMSRAINNFCVAKLNNLANALPKALFERFRKFRNAKDAQLFVLGKLLVKEALLVLDHPQLTLDQLQTTSTGRPTFNSTLDFNISHAGDYVICAASAVCRVGVDIEQIKPLPLELYNRCWTSAEQNRLMSDKNLQTFYSLWTRKEAVLKADGMGLHDELHKIDVLQDILEFNTNTWYLQNLQLADDYIAHLATNRPQEPVKIIPINFS